MKKFYLIIALVVIGVVVLAAVLLKNWVQEIPYAEAQAAEFAALHSDAGGVDTSSAFQFTFESEVSSASVRRFLSVEPEIELGIHQGTKRNEVLLVPAEPLQEGIVYTFTLETAEKSVSWAFQTKMPLAISEVSPADRSSDYPLTSQIDIILNQMTPLDLTQVAQYITITPAVAGSFSQDGRVLSFIPTQELTPGIVYQVKIVAGLPAAASNLTLEKGLSFSFETTTIEAPEWGLSGSASFNSGNNPSFVLTPTALAASESWRYGFYSYISVQAALYRYASADSYALALGGVMASYPGWSQGHLYLSGLDISHTALYREDRLTLESNEGEYVLTWPEALPEGYYLLRCQYSGQSRDLLFAVSGIDAYLLADEDETLLWLHDAGSYEPVSAEISWAEDQSAASDEEGMARLERQGDAIYTINAGGHTLVLPCYQPPATPVDNYANWRYLYLDQKFYQRGDTLNYWGLVKPRDGSELTYERVSVFITSAASGEIIYKDYAPLDGDLFSGSIVLPALLAGDYCLEIWQSGSELVGRDFYVGEQVISVAKTDEASATQLTPDVEAVILDQPDGYLPDDPVQITSGILGERGYLFIVAESGISMVSATDQSKCYGTFAPKNCLNSYVGCVVYNQGKYIAEKPALLALDSNANLLQIAVSGSLLGERSGETGTLEIGVRDSDGQPQAANLCVSLVASEEKPDLDAHNSIFSDYAPSGVGYELMLDETVEQGSGNAADCLFFATLATDGEGNANCTYQLPEFSGNCWLIIQAVASQDGVKAGSVVLAYGDGSADDQADEPEAPEPLALAYETGELTTDSTFPEQTKTMIFSSAERLQVISLLLDAFIAYREDPGSATAEQAIAAAHARQLLLDYGGDNWQEIAGPPIDLVAYQHADGGLGDVDAGSQLALSVKAIAAAPDGIDYAALLAYYRTYLETPGSRLEQIIALTGLALYQQPVLNDVRLMLAKTDLTDEEYFWLLLALNACGDQRNAAELLQARLASDAEFAPQAAALATWLEAAVRVNDAVSRLVQARAAGNQFPLEQVLVARTMLPQLSAPEMILSYHLDGAAETARISGINDLILTGAPDTEMEISGITGEIYYLGIYGQD